MIDQTYLPNKTVTLKEDNLDAGKLSTIPTANDGNSGFTNSTIYLAHKTVTVIVTNNEDTANNTSNTTYPNAKTVNLIAEKAVDSTEEKGKSSIIIENYSSHKTVSLSDEKPAEKNEEKPNALNVTKPNQTTVSPTAITSDGSYLTHKTFTVGAEKIETKAASPSVVLPGNSYLSHKTVNLAGQTDVSISVTETLSVEKTDGLTKGNYPIHKTFIINIEEIIITSVNEGITPISNRIPTAKEERTPSKNIQTQVDSATVKSKIPVLWISLSVFFFLTSAVIAFVFYTQQSSLQEELVQLKQNKEELTEELKKFQKDIHIDDIITRGVKFNPQSGITVVSTVDETEAIRVCFSVTGNLNAKTGMKTVFIRLIGPDNNVLTKTKENIFQYRGKEVPYSLKEEVEFKNQELMLCFDYKLDEPFVKGEYKAEIYNDEVLDGMVTFQLE